MHIKHRVALFGKPHRESTFGKQREQCNCREVPAILKTNSGNRTTNRITKYLGMCAGLCFNVGVGILCVLGASFQ